MKMDWRMRHHHLAVLSVRRPAMFAAIVNQLTQDECLWGGCICPRLLAGTVIIARDIDRHAGKLKQVKLGRYFVKRRAS